VLYLKVIFLGMGGFIRSL